MNKKKPSQKEFREVGKEAVYFASRLEGKVKNAGIKNIKKKAKSRKNG